MTDSSLPHQETVLIFLGRGKIYKREMSYRSSIQLIPNQQRHRPIESYIEVLNSEDEVLYSFNIYQIWLPGKHNKAHVESSW